MRADGNRQLPDAGSRTAPLYRIGGSPREPRLPVRVVILGATGSIGVQAVDLAVRQPERLQVVGLAAWSRVDELATLVRRWTEDRPPHDDISPRSPGTIR